MKLDPNTIDRFHRNFNVQFNRPDRPQPERAPCHDTPYSSTRSASPYGPSHSPSSAHQPPVCRPRSANPLQPVPAVALIATNLLGCLSNITRARVSHRRPTLTSTTLLRCKRRHEIIRSLSVLSSNKSAQAQPSGLFPSVPITVFPISGWI